MLPEINSVKCSEDKTEEITQRVEQKVQLEEKKSTSECQGNEGTIYKYMERKKAGPIKGLGIRTTFYFKL